MQTVSFWMIPTPNRNFARAANMGAVLVAVNPRLFLRLSDELKLNSGNPAFWRGRQDRPKPGRMYLSRVELTPWSVRRSKARAVLVLGFDMNVPTDVMTAMHLLNLALHNNAFARAPRLRP